MVRAAALLALGAALGAYEATGSKLPDVPLGAEVAILGGIVIPATFALILLALPVWRARLVGPVALVLAGLAALLDVAGLDLAANFLKLAAATGAGWFFLRYFEDVSWVVLVALIIIPVDAFSVARGPTRQILEEEPEVFDHLSIDFQVPGADFASHLGLPDVLFFALFLAATVRFGLRTRATWVACALSFGVTLAITAYADVTGLPALPLLSAAFVLVNADVLWRRFETWRRGRRSA